MDMFDTCKCKFSNGFLIFIEASYIVDTYTLL